MNVIKGLLKKDLLNLASYKQSLLIIIAFLAIFSAFNKGMVKFLPIAVSTAMGMIVLSTFNYDEISKSNRYILTLPASRKDSVREKYILAIGATMLGGMLGMVLTIIVVNIMNYIRPENIINLDYQSLIISTMGGIFAISFLQAVQIPSMYKWGAEKGRIQMFILIFLIIAIIIGGAFLFSHLKLGINIEKIGNFLSNYGLIILIITTMLMLYISYKTSCKIYCKKNNN